MKTASWLSGLTVLLGLAVPALAHADQTLAQKNACMACHAAQQKLVGPAFQDVASKYAAQADAQAYLVKSIKAGGSGKWGPVPMPAQPALSDADTQTLAAWILKGAR
ncbi:c-type cytochrome [Comamonas testosteroni]|uniref:c-type cytochrome n=1 Tax=Comamonas testosteroni TaxID=285 RepID=UPI00389B25E1